MTKLPTPVQSVEELLPFLSEWYQVPLQSGQIELPFCLPKPLRDIYLVFGHDASRNIERSGSCKVGFVADGMFATQDFLAPLSLLPDRVFIARSGPFKNQRMLTFVCENQWVWALHIPLEAGDDPPVFISYNDGDLDNDPLNQIAARLTDFLIGFLLQEAVLRHTRRWYFYGDISMISFRIGISPIFEGCYVESWAKRVYYVDESQHVLMMTHLPSNELDADVLLAARNVVLDEVVVNSAEFEPA